MTEKDIAERFEQLERDNRRLEALAIAAGQQLEGMEALPDLIAEGLTKWVSQMLRKLFAICLELLGLAIGLPGIAMIGWCFWNLNSISGRAADNAILLATVLTVAGGSLWWKGFKMRGQQKWERLWGSGEVRRQKI